MKTLQTLMFAMALLVAGPTAMAQEGDILGTIMEAAAAHENASNQAQSEANSQAQSEAAAAWQEEWEEIMNENGEILNTFDNKYLQATALMVLYVHAYLKLVTEHKIGETKMTVCDAYGMETLFLASSTTIIYLPEEMDKLEDRELERILEDFKNNLIELDLADGGNSQSIHRLLDYIDYINHKMIDTLLELPPGQTPYIPEGSERAYLMRYMIWIFNPKYIIPRTFKIAQEMEARGCSNPN